VDTRTIGRLGPKVSTLGLGCNNFGGRSDEEKSRAVVFRALDVGVTLFDTADVYPLTSPGRSEEILGRALGARRKDVVVATKFGLPMDPEKKTGGGSRAWVMAAAEGSLKRLGTDYIDLLQLHYPDPAVPVEETLRALDDLVKAGKVRAVGCSNMPGWQVVHALWASEKEGLARFVSSQNQYSLLSREAEPELVDALRIHGLGLLPYFPLAGGFLSGKYRRGAALPQGARLTNSEALRRMFVNDARYDVIERLEPFCAARGITLLQLAFRWLLAQDVVPSVIAGASAPAQVEENARAVAGALTDEDLAEVERLAANKPPAFGAH
jgi:aryl-alcohol dehydrogenase-like predicted oxidoreductase